VIRRPTRLLWTERGQSTGQATEEISFRASRGQGQSDADCGLDTALSSMPRSYDYCKHVPDTIQLRRKQIELIQAEISKCKACNNNAIEMHCVLMAIV
jgi:hypothetical protein